MKKVLGIICSPRKGGNCELMVKEISRQVPESHELELLRVQDFNILPCIGCYRCLEKEKCMLEDDLPIVIQAMVAADALIVAAPTYCLGANASLKRLLDRLFPFYPHIEAMWGRPAVGIAIAGIHGKEGHTLLDIQTFLKFFMTEIKASRVVYGAMPGEVFLDEANTTVAQDLGAALFGDPARQEAPACPVCGGDTFRFLDDGQVRCMLCSNVGTLRMAGDVPEFEIAASDHELFLNKAAVIAHRDWLIGMKERFFELKRQLKEVSRAHGEGGTWISK